MEHDHEVYSDRQDMVRYYGIRYLADLADRGETEPLEAAIVQLSTTLLQAKHWMKGQWNDLEDLLKASISQSDFKDRWGLSEYFEAKGLAVSRLEPEEHKDFFMAVLHRSYDGLRSVMSHKSAE